MSGGGPGRQWPCGRNATTNWASGSGKDTSSPRRPAVHLTRREQDIVELAVQGLTDREIAQRLMVSVRTVEGHLYRTYVKLGVRSRDELASALPKK